MRSTFLTQLATDHTPTTKHTEKGNVITIDATSTELAIEGRVTLGGTFLTFKDYFEAVKPDLKHNTHITQAMYFATLVDYNILALDHNDQYIPPMKRKGAEVFAELEGKHGRPNFDLYAKKDSGFGFYVGTQEALEYLNNEIKPILVDTLETIGQELDYAYQEATDVYNLLKVDYSTQARRDRKDGDVQRHIEASTKREAIFKLSKLEILKRNLHREQSHKLFLRLV
jgi:hypothetical protein